MPMSKVALKPSPSGLQVEDHDAAGLVVDVAAIVPRRPLSPFPAEAPRGCTLPDRESSLRMNAGLSGRLYNNVRAMQAGGAPLAASF